MTDILDLPEPERVTLKISRIPRHHVRMALLTKYENRCQSCLGIFEPENLYMTRMGPLLDDEPMVNMTLLCESCQVRFHTEGAIHHGSTTTP